MKKLKIFVLVTLIAGICSLLLMLSIPADPKNEMFFGFSTTRLLMMGTLLGANLFLAWVGFHLMVRGRVGQKIESMVETFFENEAALFIALLLAVLGAITAGLFAISWFILGDRYFSIYQRLAPMVIFTAIICAQLIVAINPHLPKAKNGYFKLRQSILEQIHKAMGRVVRFYGRFSFIQGFADKHKLQQWFMIILLPVLTVVYLRLSEVHAKTQNLGLEHGDQGIFLEFAAQVSASNFRNSGGRNQMPVYAYLQALFYDPQSENAFLQGKYVNIGLSIILLLLTFLVLSKVLDKRQAAFYVFIVAFSLFIFRAGYFQAELLFYFWIFVSFVLMGSMMVAPSKKLGLSTGIISGLAQLTKASMLPGLGVFTFFYILNSGLFVYKALRNPTDRVSLLRQVRNQLFSLLFLWIGFMGVIFPYIRESKQVYGQYFYNVNSTFYIWYDSWEEAEEGTIAHGDRQGWPDMPAEDIPSFSKYMREHTLDQILGRFERGAKKVISNLIVPYGQFNYLLILFICLVFAGIKWRRVSIALLQKNAILVGFTLAFLGAYLFLYAWYRPISGGYRFTYSLYMITLFVLLAALDRLFSKIGTIQVWGTSGDAYGSFLFLEKILVVLLVVDIVFFIPVQLDIGYFGG